MESLERNKSEKPFNPEEATDIEVAQFFSFHIDNPCEVEVAPGEKVNIRGFYIREAKRILDEKGKNRLTNPLARELLEGKIKEYEK